MITYLKDPVKSGTYKKQNILVYIYKLSSLTAFIDWLIALTLMCLGCLGDHYTGLGAPTMDHKKDFSRFLSLIVSQGKIY